MIKCYVGTKIIKAEPATKDGVNGYTVYYPDGYTSWSPKDTFEIAYREVTFHERQLIEMTDVEASIAKISDGEHKCSHASGEHHWQEDFGEWNCVHCGAERFTDPNPGGP